ncbi:MAG TPA: alpha-L-fucosidase [Sedimentisphaerales bacterium]|nr:alpha-L-fucosidase [Sedimentisphaerales bacterium]
MRKILSRRFLVLLLVLGASGVVFCQDMDEMWGEQVMKLKAADAERGQLFTEGNYAMFIHWGLYSHIGNHYKGKSYYGIGEWIMNGNMANIPVEEYQALAAEFNPVKFDADEIAKLAKDAGMKYIVITSKHHDGFAMYHSQVNKFNIVDATPFDRDPMKELAQACKRHGLGLGCYYSHYQDWTFPGGGNGPKQTADGRKVDFKYYYENKCRAQVEEITTQYGPIAIVWLDTPGRIPREYVEELVQIVRKNQPEALVSGRAGYELGDYQTLGDMEVPHENVEGIWETVDTINDSWAYAWYDNYWKTPEEILGRLISCVSRGGTYMLNIGPKGDGTVPELAARTLRKAGEWIKRYPQVVYGTDASPWKHALPWGDVTVKNSTLFLCIFDRPKEGELYLPGLKTKVKSARLLGEEKKKAGLKVQTKGNWTKITLPARTSEKMVPVVQVELDGQPEVDPCWGIDPALETTLLAQFADVTGAKQEKNSWMEKFGEWKHVVRVWKWEQGGRASWEVDVLKPGYYNVDLTYIGTGRIVWGVDIEGGEHIQNQQNSSHNYQKFPIGWINFPKAGRYQVSVSCIEGDLAEASLKAIHFTFVD